MKKELQPNEHHFLGRLLGRIPFKPFPRAALISVTSYLLFLILASLSAWNEVTRSFLHWWQISISVTIFLGAWLGFLALREFDAWFGYIEKAGVISTKDRGQLLKQTQRSLANPLAFFFGLIFLIPALTIALQIVAQLPNAIFPFTSLTPAFIYVVFIEICVLMVPLMGSAAFWWLYLFGQLAKDLTTVKSLDYSLADSYLIKKLATSISKVSFWFFLVLATAMPGIAYVGSSFGELSQTLVYIFGVFLPVGLFFFGYFFPSYYLHKLFETSKEKRLDQLKEDIKQAEKVVRVSLKTGTRVSSKKLEKQIDVVNFLYARFKDEENQRSGLFSIDSILKILGSAALPVVGFFGDVIVAAYF